MDTVVSEEIAAKLGTVLSPDRVEDIVLVASELVTNANRTDAEPARYATAVHIWASFGELVLGIGDTSPEYARDGRGTEEAGRGLLITMALSNGVRWTSVPTSEAAPRRERITRKIVRAFFDI